jgi:enoyl-CoA hydratase
MQQLKSCDERGSQHREHKMADDIATEDKLIGRREGSVGHVIFNNPARHNAVSLEMWQTALKVIEGFAKDPEIRSLVVTGNGGKAFVSGADISKFESERSSEDAAAKYNAASGAVYEALYNFGKPTIAKIRGYCIGGGMNVAACCDLRFCNDAAKFGIPAAQRALGYGFDPIRRASEVIGLSRTLEMIYTARQFNATEAYAMGLVNGVKADADLDQAVADVCTGNAPLTIALAKATAREISKPESKRDFAKLTAMSKACFDSEDYKEATTSFMEKRKPVFKGE